MMLAFAVALPLSAQQIDHLEFINAPVRDILVALGSATGNSVIPDETVTGSASFSFTNTDFESAVAVLAAQFELFVTRVGSVTTVSAVRIITDAQGRFSIDAPSVDIGHLLRRLSREARQPVLFDSLPPVTLTYHTRDATLAQVLENIASQLPSHELIQEDGAFVFSRLAPSGTPAAAPDDWRVHRAEDTYTARVTSARFSDLIATLFEAGEREYQMLKRSSPTITDLSFSAKSFDELLTLICERADAQYSTVGEIYYIADAPPPAALARAQQTVIVHPRWWPLASLMDALPGEQTAGATLRPDRAGNSVSITGTPQTVERIVGLIHAIDVPPPELEYHRFTVRNIPLAALPSLLPRHLSGLTISPLPDNESFITMATQRQAADLRRYLAMIDVPPTTTPIELEHIQVETLMQNLPASAPPGTIIPTGDPGRFFFRGSAEERSRFLDELEAIDLPLPQVRYQLLVVQYEEGTARDFAFNLSNSVTGPDSAQAFLGNIGNLLSLNFDIIAAFGYQFAARLDAQISDSTATVLVDTTLNALSGQSVRFQSTNTYRYRDTVVDAETNESVATGVVREITSGLVLQIDGWVSGSDSVTMDVSATLSKRGTDASDGNPPRTSEKVVDTHIRAACGEPVVLSGLIQQEVQKTVSGTPLLARIPLVGLLFQKRHETLENTELAIYIIPTVEQPETDHDEIGARLMQLYDRFGRESP
jgi:general secretion pathway protein D